MCQERRTCKVWGSRVVGRKGRQDSEMPSANGDREKVERRVRVKRRPGQQKATGKRCQDSKTKHTGSRETGIRDVDRTDMSKKNPRAEQRAGHPGGQASFL